MNKIFHKNNFENITTLKKGLWGHSAFLTPDTSFRDGLNWSFRLVETTELGTDSIEVISITDIIKEFDLEFIDFLKIDIEGGEASVFHKESDIQWLKKVRVIALEIHDEFDCRSEIENILSNFGFILSNNGELTIGINTKYKHLMAQNLMKPI
jgi:FkbM family methyltransferase